jgi:hypothetical protein
MAEPLRITVRPEPNKYGTTYNPEDEAGEAQAARDTAAARVQAKYGLPYDPASEQQQEQLPGRKVSTPEAAAVGLEQGLSFGAGPAVHGLSEAGGEAAKPGLEDLAQRWGIAPDKIPALEPHQKAAIGAATLLTDWLTGHEDPSVKEAYERGRKAAQETKDLAKDQHAIAYMGGVLAGTVANPMGGPTMTPAATGGRVVQGIVQGGRLGGLEGAGEAIGEGKSVPEIAKQGAKGMAIGAGTGGTMQGTFGPRVVTNTPGRRAAATAEALGAPLPKGVASDRPVIQRTTAALSELPFVGSRIKTKVRAAERAAGTAIEGEAERMTGGATSRAGAQVGVQPGLDAAIAANRAEQDALYDVLRNQHINQVDLPMPRTARARAGVIAARTAAGHPNPEAGLEQVDNVARSATFNGAHRARTDVRNAGDPRNPNPGYNSADFNRIERAMTADIRDMVQASAVDQTPAGRAAALRAFDEAERRFGPLADANALLRRLRDAQGEGGIAALLGAAKEKSGNLQLLADLRRTMPRQSFDMVGGLLLHELGYSTRTGEFSLAKFGTEFNKLSDQAINTLYSPTQAQALRRIAEMGRHIGEAMAEKSSSHSSNWLAMFDVLKDVALLAHDFGAHGVGLGPESVVAAASTGGMYAWAWLLGNSARVNATSHFMQAYMNVTGSQTPARIAAFKIATRNLANTLNVPADRLIESITARVGRAEGDNQGQLEQK